MYTTAEDTMESWTLLMKTVEDYKAIRLQQIRKVDSTQSCFNIVDHALLRNEPYRLAYLLLKRLQESVATSVSSATRP